MKKMILNEKMFWTVFWGILAYIHIKILNDIHLTSLSSLFLGMNFRDWIRAYVIQEKK